MKIPSRTEHGKTKPPPADAGGGLAGGYKPKKANSSYGSMGIQVPQDRKSTFEPQVVKKRRKDISDFDQKNITGYSGCPPD